MYATKNSTVTKRVPIVENYFDLFASVQDGLDHINATLGTSFKHNSVSLWRRGATYPSRPVYEVMVRRVLRDNDVPRHFLRLIRCSL